MAAERAAQSGIAGDAMTVEWTLAAHPAVAEVIATLATCVREADCIRCFIVPAAGHEPDDALEALLTGHVREAMGVHMPRLDIRFVDALPKTRTGKVMRWVLDEGPAADCG
jgi:acyl-coenzyme A synthetase/AMP-(fatty) acid ligase